MRIVTVHTSPVSGRLVGHSLRCGIVVALEAQAFPGFDQKGAVGRSMRAMARIAAVILDDGVKSPLVSRIIVAFDTKLPLRCNQ
jgi:hypothetical protein